MKTLDLVRSNYRIIDNSLVLDQEPKTYVLKIHDLPDDERPREKMLKSGSTSLSSPELLAIILGIGSKKEGVMEMCHRILKEYGAKGLANHNDPILLAKELDIPISKALQVVACCELGRRFFEKNGNGLATVRNAQDVFEYAKDMRELPKENLRGLYLNAHHKVIHDETISIGTADSNLIHPREVFKPALEYSAVAMILVHNHPSGDSKPSQADIEITNQLVKAGKMLGIDLLDHVVVTKDGFTSVSAEY
ncbi:MAG: DNA repair protein RadC [Minisyncoccia bacterium]